MHWGWGCFQCHLWPVSESAEGMKGGGLGGVGGGGGMGGMGRGLRFERAANICKKCAYSTS